ncbi:NTP transferase domain-containing protein [Desulfosporosinus sp. FKA]|uniref:NTP transferase domain-containing protein n=1 Tax=Desulfosporosinus sp. FKA TaxID=1969834 RepID=UPI000B4A223D|nr:NTP transferase domain-containing protein [Desulfosporosinus sp. FKA]
MKAIILAAGHGTRLKKYTENLPKGMLAFFGKALIERQIELYKRAGIDDIIIVRGYAADKIDYNCVRYYLNENFATTNMVESLMTARSEFNDDISVAVDDN